MIPQQNTPEWLAWRKDKIGASDAPIIMGVSPWTTPYQLWQQKMGLTPPIEENDAMRRGKRLEPVALEMLNESHGCKMKSTVLVSPSHHWQIASLDGYQEGAFCEIKCPGKEDHQLAFDRQIPSKYVPQLMHQFMVSGCDFAYYVSYRPEATIQPLIIIEISRECFEERYYTELFEREKQFYKCMVEFEAPELTDKDYQIIDDMEIKNLVNEFIMLNTINKMNEKKENELRKMIIEGCKGHSSICNGLKILKFPRRGNIEYSNIPELKGVDLDPYRKPTTDQWRLSYGDTT